MEGAPTTWATATTSKTEADSNLKAWKKAGVKTVITPCAECFHTFSRKYTAKAGSEIKVIHMVQFVDAVDQAGQTEVHQKR